MFDALKQRLSSFIGAVKDQSEHQISAATKIKAAVAGTAKLTESDIEDTLWQLQTDLMQSLNGQGIQITRTAVTKLETGFRCVRDFEVVALAGILKTTPQYLLTGRSK